MAITQTANKNLKLPKYAKYFTKQQIVKAIEIYVNNPDKSFDKLSEELGIGKQKLSEIISRHYFNSRIKNPQTITLKSKV